MRLLLDETMFDSFYICSGQVQTFATFDLNGKLNMDFFGPDEKELLGGRETALWKNVKPYIYQLMKGKKLPVSFHFTLQLSRENTDWLLGRYGLEDLKDKLSGLYLNIIYRNNKISCVTGLAYDTFVMDKRLEQIWDETAGKYLKQNNIAYEQ